MLFFSTDRQRRLVARREEFDAPCGVDWQSTARAIRDVKDDMDFVLLNRIATAGVMNEDIMKHVDTLSNGECPWCGAPKQDRRHMWWQCVEFNAIRQKIWGGAAP